ncbi:MAG: hypothetical protein CMA79_00065 [Euryarchaeota archaeon]|nr:hypothetical protein [Euryarchaeota archaeon]MED5398318.1 hypothetical protein [Candidatus Thermoplasmatota archaeon]
MGVGRALLFALLGAIPGVFLALIGWAISGSPDEWSNVMWLTCYFPFFGCIAAGFIIGWRGGGETTGA